MIFVIGIPTFTDETTTRTTESRRYILTTLFTIQHVRSLGQVNFSNSLILKCYEVFEYSNISSVFLNGVSLDMTPDPLPDVVSGN